MNTKQMQLHVTILGWLYVVTGFLALIGGVLMFFFLTGLSTVVLSGDPVAFRILNLVGTWVGGFVALLSIPSLVAGFGLLARKAWARGLALVVGILRMINVPVGTLIGIYTLWVLLQDESQEYFALRVA